MPGLCVVGVVGFFFPGEFVSTPRALDRFLIERRRLPRLPCKDETQRWKDETQRWGMKLRDETHPQEYPYRIGKARQI